MSQRALYFVAALLLAFAQPAHAAPEFGILQFHVAHNLETPDCLATQTCMLQFEEVGDIAGWLAEIRRYSDLAVLHWDRGVPWLIFDQDPPPAGDRVAFYDARLDAPTVAWLDAFVTHFAATGRGFLAVALLSGERNRLAELYLGLENNIESTGLCPDFSPGTQVTVDPGSGPVSFDLERSYRNFLLYLAAKLSPDYLGLIVEANLIEQTCPARAAGLYSLYRSLYDDIRAALGPEIPLFATLSYPPLLAYSVDTCFPSANFALCDDPPDPPAPNAGVNACFPTNRSAIDALDLGGRLDILALSFYPDGLEMNPVSSETAETRAYELDAWNNGGACLSRKTWPDPLDPLSAIDRLGWTKPIAVAETSARSCVSPARIDLTLPGQTTENALVLEIAGSPASQVSWTAQTLDWARQRNFLFYLQSFLRDYPPVGPWTVDQGLIDAPTQNLFNIWTCSGLQDENGVLKPEIAAIGLPEPYAAPALLFCLIAMAALVDRRRRKILTAKEDAP